MCISLPGKVLAINGQVAEVDTAGNRRTVLVAVPSVEIGSWVLIHSGIAIAQLEPEAAEETIQLLSRLTEASHNKEALDRQQSTPLLSLPDDDRRRYNWSNNRTTEAGYGKDICRD